MEQRAGSGGGGDVDAAGPTFFEKEGEGGGATFGWLDADDDDEEGCRGGMGGGREGGGTPSTRSHEGSAVSEGAYAAASPLSSLLGDVHDLRLYGLHIVAATAGRRSALQSRALAADRALSTITEDPPDQ